MYVKLSSTNYRHSPLVQGGLQIACSVVVKMPATVKNHMLIDRYAELVNMRYADPKEEIVLGSFLVAIPSQVKVKISQPKKAKTKNTNKSCRTVDIRDMFSRVTQQPTLEPADVSTTLSVQNLAFIKFGDWQISDFSRGINLAIQNIG